MTAIALADARAVLLEGLIDDAGLFPPAQKPMSEAIADHARARAGDDGFMLGRFVCPASRLRELDGHDVGDIAVVLDGIDGNWRSRVGSALSHVADRPERVTAIEVVLPADGSDPSAADWLIHELHERGLDGRLVTLEIGSRERSAIEAALSQIAAKRGALKLAAKFRCGGLSGSDVPTDEQLAGFLRAACALDVPFKLTAGLHHPFRTYDASIDALQHGFINVLTAVALAPDDPAPALSERDSAAFGVDGAGLSWDGRHADGAVLARTRERFVAIGSCGFDEAVEDLRAHGVLPLPPVVGSTFRSSSTCR